MLTGIDHTVIVVRDLAQAMEDYGRAGFTVTPGGEHTDRDTRNALIGLADGSYIELIAFRDPDRPHDDAWWRRLALGEGLLGYALASDDLEADTKPLRERGLEVDGPRDGGRARPDGQRLAWRTVQLREGLAFPFLIEDVTPRELRVPGGPAAQHALGVTRTVGLRVVVRDLASAVSVMQRLLGTDAEVTGGGGTRRFAVRQQWIELAGPSGDLMRARHLEAYGPGPYELVLGTDGESGTEGQLLGGSAGELHGARIRIVG